MQTQKNADLHESHDLIASDKVVGTKVCDPMAIISALWNASSS